MKRSLLFLVLGFVLVFSLAACGDSKDSEEQEPEDKNATLEDLPEEIKKEDDEEKESISEPSNEGDTLLGATAEELKEQFNESASNRNLEFAIDEYRWELYESGETMASFHFDDDISLTTAAEEGGSQELRAVLLEVNGHESRELVLDTIEALIESTNLDLTADNLTEIMKELGLTDPNKAGNIEDTVYVHDGLKYLLNEEEDNWVEFAIANENDPDLGVE